MNLRAQLEEIQLIQCSLLPSELFKFILPHDDFEEWSRLLHDYADLGTTPNAPFKTAATCRFQVRVLDVPIWFEIELPREYPEREEPLIYVRGENLDRLEQERWQTIVKSKLADLKIESTDDNQFLVQDLLCQHLIQLLHESTTSPKSSLSSPPTSSISISSISTEIYHALFTSHHLISPTKRRNLQKWSSELRLRGFAKVGYPGVIYAEGAQADIAEFVSRVKAMQWLALRVRFEERLDEGKYGALELGLGGSGRGQWIELNKVGEVVEIMRQSGREEFVTEMGLGSSGGPS